MFIKPDSFHLSNGDVLFFDIFWNDGIIYLICPLYDCLDLVNLEIKVNTHKLAYHDRILRGGSECVSIYCYKCPNFLERVTVKYKEKEKEFVLKKTNKRECQLSLTTLFKGDLQLFPLFYDYYVKQGVSDFYMYYNGKITPSIERLFDKPGVILVEWDFKYWHRLNNKQVHYAQTGQMHDAIYRFGKGNDQYMIFCDLDEYMHIPKFSLLSYILANPNYDAFGFTNHWSVTLDGKIPTVSLPNQIKTSSAIKYGIRSKNIYKTTAISAIGIHITGSVQNSIKLSNEQKMFHFYNWTKKGRKFATNLIYQLG